MPERIPVAVYARDPISQAGIASQLRARPEVALAENGDAASAAVAIVVADEVDEPTIQTLRAVQRSGCRRVLLVATRLDDGALLSAVEAGACGMLRRTEAMPERLVGGDPHRRGRRRHRPAGPARPAARTGFPVAAAGTRTAWPAVLRPGRT